MLALGIKLTLQRSKCRNVMTSAISGLLTSETTFKAKGTQGEHEVQCVKRKVLLEFLEKELPSGTIRYSSMVISIEESGYFKPVHLAGGTTPQNQGVDWV